MSRSSICGTNAKVISVRVGLKKIDKTSGENLLRGTLGKKPVLKTGTLKNPSKVQQLKTLPSPIFLSLVLLSLVFVSLRCKLGHHDFSYQLP